MSDSPAAKLAALLGESAVRPLADWEGSGRLARLGLGGDLPVALPTDRNQLAEVMKLAARDRLRVLPVGRASRADWGGLPTGIDCAVSTARLDRLVEHAAGDLTVTAEAGMGFADLQRTLAGARQFLTLDPAYPEASTLGGILATADTGALRHRYGGVRDLVLGITFVRADGEIARAGGRVVKNVAGYDLMKLLTGAHGTLGIAVEITFRLQPLPETGGTVLIAGEAEPIADLVRALNASALTPERCDLFSATAARALGFDGPLLFAVRFAGIAASVAEQSALLVKDAPPGTTRRLAEDEEAAFWEHARLLFWQGDPGVAVVGKWGVLPTAAVAALVEAERLGAMGRIHAGGGVGVVRWQSPDPQTIGQLRTFCREHSGTLSVLEAPRTCKQQIDVWGAVGALALMGRIKNQFDPQGVLSPGRFVAGL